MPAGDRVYKASPQMIESLRTAYDQIHIAEDLNRREREAGNPDAEREAKIALMRENAERRAKAYDIDLT